MFKHHESYTISNLKVIKKATKQSGKEVFSSERSQKAKKEFRVAQVSFDENKKISYQIFPDYTDPGYHEAAEIVKNGGDIRQLKEVRHLLAGPGQCSAHPSCQLAGRV